MVEGKIIKKGPYKGEKFVRECPLKDIVGTDNLVVLASRGNIAAINALGHYNHTNSPFCYGKIGILGYIVSEADLEDD